MEDATEPTPPQPWQFDKATFDLQPQHPTHILRGWERVPMKAAVSQQKDRMVWKRPEQKSYQYETEHGGAGFTVNGAKRVRTQNMPALPAKKGRCRGRPTENEAEDDLYARRRKSTRLSSLNAQRHASPPAPKPRGDEARRSIKTRDSLRSPLKELRVMALTQNAKSKKPRTSISTVLQNGTPMRKIFADQPNASKALKAARPSIGGILGSGTPMRLAFAEQENQSPVQDRKEFVASDVSPIPEVCSPNGVMPAQDESSPAMPIHDTPECAPRRRSLRLSGQRKSSENAALEFPLNEDGQDHMSEDVHGNDGLENTADRLVRPITPQSALELVRTIDDDPAYRVDATPLGFTNRFLQSVENIGTEFAAPPFETGTQFMERLDDDKGAEDKNRAVNMCLATIEQVEEGEEIKNSLREQESDDSDLAIAYGGSEREDNETTATATTTIQESIDYSKESTVPNEEDVTPEEEHNNSEIQLAAPAEPSHLAANSIGPEPIEGRIELPSTSKTDTTTTTNEDSSNANERLEIMAEDQNVLSVLQTELRRESSDAFQDGAENDSGDELAADTISEPFPLTSAPQEAEYPDSPRKRKAPRLSDDTSILKDFLIRTQAKRAAEFHASQLLSAKLGPSIHLSPRRSPRRAAASPGRAAPSPSKRKHARAAPDTPTKKTWPPMQDPGEQDELCSPIKVTRRSARSKPTPTKPGMAAPSLIPLRRPSGQEAVKLKKSETQELAMATRTNTRRNKGLAKMPKFVLEDISQKELSPIKTGGRAPKEKAVEWQKELVSYLGEKADRGAGSGREKQKRTKGLGTANGTPAKPKAGKVGRDADGLTPSRRLRSAQS